MKCAVDGCSAESTYRNGLCSKHHLAMMQEKRSIGWEGKPLNSYPEFKVWDCMRARCSNPHNVSYGRYGGAGIKVCEAWRSSFQRFYQDMGPRPQAGYQIDRIDPKGDYSPENCRWVTGKENRRSSRQNVLDESKVLELRNDYRKSGKSMMAFARDIGMNYYTVRSAIKGINWGDV